jgi:hypothetical protein
MPSRGERCYVPDANAPLGHHWPLCTAVSSDLLVRGPTRNPLLSPEYCAQHSCRRCCALVIDEQGAARIAKHGGRALCYAPSRKPSILGQDD